ncbi:hypothetical protein ACWEQ8_41750 [Streptomyces noursei]
MSTERKQALAALREWSTPGRRAVLVAAAWTAGATNVVELAEAARVGSRTTIYEDLKSQGIDHRNRPTEDTTMTTPIVIDGLNGLDGEADGRSTLNAMRRYAADNPTGRGITEFEGDLVRLRSALCVYNTLRPLLAAEERTRLDRDRALHLVEIRWEALTTAANWLAAHHAYVVAVDDARTAISTWCGAATAAAQADWFHNDRELQAYEERILSAGHPPLRRVGFADNERNQLLDRLKGTHTRRKALAAETLGLKAAGAR